MGNFISYPPYNLSDAGRLTNAIYRLLHLPYKPFDGVYRLTEINEQLKALASKYGLSLKLESYADLGLCCIAANDAALQLIERGILTERNLCQELKNLN